jgi:hypothetical protein
MPPIRESMRLVPLIRIAEALAGSHGGQEAVEKHPSIFMSSQSFYRVVCSVWNGGLGGVEGKGVRSQKFVGLSSKPRMHLYLP